MNTLVPTQTNHSHPDNPDRIPTTELQNRIKHETATTDQVTIVILQSALRTYPLNAADQLLRNAMMGQTIRRQRTAIVLASIERLLVKLTKTDRGEDFVQYEHCGLILFTTKTNLFLLEQSKPWFSKGTCKVSYQ
jgi:hypothetical protein